MSDESKKEESEGFSKGTIIFAVSLFGACLLLLVPSIIKHHSKEVVVRGPEQGEATIYDVGLTTCGTEHGDDELIAGISKKHWKAPNPKADKLCGKKIQITEGRKGRSVVAWVKDKCLSCTIGDIQLSTGAFSALAKPKVGQVAVTWEFVD